MRETLGFLAVIKIMHEHDLDEVEFEKDSKSIADNVNNQQLSLLEFCEIINKC